MKRILDKLQLYYARIKQFKYIRIVLLIFLVLLTSLLVTQVMRIQDNRNRASGPLTPPVTQSPSQITAARFDGSTGYFVVNPLPTKRNDYTIESWINPSQVSGTPVLFGMVSDPTATTCKSGPFVYIDSVSGGYRLYAVGSVEDGSNANLFYDINATESLPVGQWTHVAINITDRNLFSLYVNGKLRDSKQLSSAMCNPGKGMRFGAGTGSPPHAASFYNGLIGPARIAFQYKYIGDFTPQTSFPVDSNSMVLNYENGSVPGVITGGVEFVQASFPGNQVAKNPINLVGDKIYIKADDFYVIANGKKFVPNSTIRVVSSSLRFDTPTSGGGHLDVEWTSDGVVMGIYFNLILSNGQWGVESFRTGNGTGAGRIYYDGFTGGVLGSELVKPVLDLSSSTSNPSGVNGAVHFENLRMLAFIVDTPSPTLTSIPTQTPSPIPTMTLTPLPSLDPLIIEAENAEQITPRSGYSWSRSNVISGAVGGNYLTVQPNNGFYILNNIVTTSPQARFRVNVPATGKYYVWVRMAAFNAAEDSVYVGVNGQPLPTALSNITVNGKWQMTNSLIGGGQAALNFNAGIQYLDMWMREDGVNIDEIILTKDVSWRPTPIPTRISSSISFEAENPVNNISRNGQSWTVRNDRTDTSGGSYISVLPDRGEYFLSNVANLSPQSRYTVNVTNPGKYNIWVRMLATNGQNDSVHVGLNGIPITSSSGTSVAITNLWRYSNNVYTLDLQSGNQYIDLWMREDGASVDKIYLTNDLSWRP